MNTFWWYTAHTDEINLGNCFVAWDRLLWCWHPGRGYLCTESCLSGGPCCTYPAWSRSLEPILPLSHRRPLCASPHCYCWLSSVQGLLAVIFLIWKNSFFWRETLIRCREGVISSFVWGQWGVRQRSTIHKLCPIWAMCHACQLSVAREPHCS